jgi:hypothetical protein
MVGVEFGGVAAGIGVVGAADLVFVLGGLFVGAFAVGATTWG